MNVKILSRKTGALILVLSMALSLCSCSMFSKKDVLAAAKEVAENIPALLMEALQANSCPLNINPMIDDIGAILKEHRGNENNNAKQTGA